MPHYLQKQRDVHSGMVYVMSLFRTECEKVLAHFQNLKYVADMLNEVVRQLALNYAL